MLNTDGSKVLASELLGCYQQVEWLNFRLPPQAHASRVTMSGAPLPSEHSHTGSGSHQSVLHRLRPRGKLSRAITLWNQPQTHAHAFCIQPERCTQSTASSPMPVPLPADRPGTGALTVLGHRSGEYGEPRLGGRSQRPLRAARLPLQMVPFPT